MIVKIILIENDKLQYLGEVLMKELIPSIGDKFYYKSLTPQYNVVERHFNILAGLGVDIELFVEKTKTTVDSLQLTSSEEKKQ
jgi:hypothetical protein